MESTPGFFFKGYLYFHEKFNEQNTDTLETRLFLKKAVVLRGEEGAKLFYDTTRFKRKGATPRRFRKTLLGIGGVQGLDGKEHLHRKELFMQVMTRSSIGNLENHFEELLSEAAGKWETSDGIVLFREMEELLCRAACKWTGVPLPENEVEKRTNQLSNMIDGSGGAGPRHRKGRKARKEAEKWLSDLVAKTRKKEKKKPGTSILSTFSFHRDRRGKLLEERIVAVEILNLLRPIVAVARYITFAALALHDHPQYGERLKKDEEDLDLCFVQEVRRYYPFFPLVTAKVKQSFEWQGVKFRKGHRVLLDLYATTHDEKIWTNAEVFYAERFKNWNGSAFNFIPQGGGDFYQNHRCAGEWVTINLTRSAINFLINEIDYTVPEQDLEIDMSRIPAIPESRFRIENIKRTLQGIQVL